MEIAIVGGGPSGARAAWKLARGGARVTILDPSHPREKPCGGGVSGRGLALVSDAIGGSLHGQVIRTARLRTSDGRSTAVPLPLSRTPSGPASLVVASRRDFDSALLAAATAAGATVMPARVRDVSRQDGRWRLQLPGGRSIAADWIIGADGTNSLVRRRVLAPFRRDQLSIATGYFAEGATSDEIVLEIVSDPPGYLWSFPRPDHIAIGIGAQADAGATPESLRQRTRRWIDDAQLAPEARLVPYSWPIPTLAGADVRALVASGPGWLLAGDAAGLVDSITREGIFFALQSGDHAASALLDSRDPARAYAERLQDEIVPELAKAAHFKAGFFQPRFVRLMLKALTESAAIREIFADLVAGAQSYRTLKWRLAGTFELGLLWRVLTSDF